jgi:hypothetical protein
MAIFRKLGFGPVFSGTAGQAVFEISSLFAAGEKGMWLDQSDTSTAFQDTGGTTPATTSGDPVGRRNDKSGRDNHVYQATSASRPLYNLTGNIHSDVFDGVDDSYATDAFTAGKFTSNMDMFFAIRRASTARWMLAADADATGRFFGIYESGSTSSATSGVGTPTYAVNGVEVAGGTATTRIQLHEAIPINEWSIVEVRNVDMSAFTKLLVYRWYGDGYFVHGRLGGLVLCPAQSAGKRDSIRGTLAAKVGLML